MLISKKPSSTRSNRSSSIAAAARNMSQPNAWMHAEKMVL